MKVIIVVYLLSIGLIYAESRKDDKADKAARIELILRQQRELEADELMLIAKKNQKAGRYEESAEGFIRAISLYERSSASEKRIVTKINNSRILLINSYKKLADQLIKQAEKESSVELFEKAEQLLLEAKKIGAKVKNLKAK